MKFLKNIITDFENYVTKTIYEKEQNILETEQKKLKELKESLNYRRTDIVYLATNGYEYNKKEDTWTKTEIFNKGKYPGKYKIKIKFPENYPKIPPIVQARPIGNIRHSEHISDDGHICIADKRHHYHNTYWKENMNAKGTILLTRFLITDELHKTETHKKIELNGTIINKIKNTGITPKQYITEHKEIYPELTNKENITWNDIAYYTQKKTIQEKRKIIDYLIKIEGETNEENNSTRNNKKQKKNTTTKNTNKTKNKEKEN